MVPKTLENRPFPLQESDFLTVMIGISKDPYPESDRASTVLFPQLIRDDICTMDLFDAIHEMRRLSKEGVPFSFSFMSCNLSNGSSDGIVEVSKARIIARESAAYHIHADFVERYMDLTTGEPRHFYQILLISFNGQMVTLQ